MTCVYGGVYREKKGNMYFIDPVSLPSLQMLQIYQWPSAAKYDAVGTLLASFLDVPNVR